MTNQIVMTLRDSVKVFELRMQEGVPTAALVGE